jgi:Domain of unknown function (DUF4296)
MNHVLLKIFLLLFVLTGCSKKNSVPKDILQPEKMENILWDMSLADEFVINYVMKDSALNKKDESTKRYQQIFTIHKTNRDDFKRSLQFYENHPVLFKPILDSLSAKQQTDMAEQYKPKTPPAVSVAAIVDSMTVNRNKTDSLNAGRSKVDSARAKLFKKKLKRKKPLRIK